jgi:hypothetical protein
VIGGTGYKGLHLASSQASLVWLSMSAPADDLSLAGGGPTGSSGSSPVYCTAQRDGLLWNFDAQLDSGPSD